MDKRKWHPIKNGKLNFFDFPKTSRVKVWWTCEKHHEWQAEIRSSKAACLYCSHQKILPGFNDLKTKNPEIASQWHPALNGTVSVAEVGTRSSKKVWWVCDKQHEFEALISNRLTSAHCPVCYGRKVLAGFNDLLTINPELAKQWHPILNKMSPSEITFGSSKKVWWTCEKHHEWQATCPDRKNSGCPYCGNKKVLIGFNNLSKTFPLSTKMWHPTLNNELTPNDFTAGSHKKVWWLGNCGHEWFRAIATQTQSEICPICIRFVSQPEKIIAEFLENKNIVLEKQNRSLLTHQELDIFLPEYKIAIEYNGSYWHSEEKGKSETYHYNKWKACQDKGIQLIYIWDFDWIDNHNAILQKITFLIENRSLSISEATILIQHGSFDESLFDLTNYQQVKIYRPKKIIENKIVVWDAGSTLYHRKLTNQK